MITITEIRKRQNNPYTHDEPYYKNNYNRQGYKHYGGYSKTYYDVHGGSAREDIIQYLSTLPEHLRMRILKEIDTTTMSQQMFEYTLLVINVFHFFYYGKFAE